MERNTRNFGTVSLAMALLVPILAHTAHADRTLSKAELTRLCRQMTPQENHILALEANYFKGGGYNEYGGGKLTLHARGGTYVLTYPVWDNRLSPAYRTVQQYILRQRLQYEMQLLAQMTMNGGGASTDPITHRPAIRRGSGAIELDRIDLAPGSTVK